MLQPAEDDAIIALPEPKLIEPFLFFLPRKRLPVVKRLSDRPEAGFKAGGDGDEGKIDVEDEQSSTSIISFTCGALDGAA